jgi:hypothetical protein
VIVLTHLIGPALTGRAGCVFGVAHYLGYPPEGMRVKLDDLRIRLRLHLVKK